MDTIRTVRRFLLIVQSMRAVIKSLRICHIAEESVIYVYGWISQEEFFSQHKIKDFGYGGRATVEAKGLNSASDLIPREQVREENTF